MGILRNILKKERLIPIFLLFVISFGFRMWGITRQFEVWDETTVIRYGEEYLNFFKDQNFSKEAWELNKEHPPFSKYFYGASRIVSLNVPLFRDKLDQDYLIGKRYTFQRIISAFIGALTVTLVFLLGYLFYSRKVGITAALILSFIPYFIAHTKVATQENLILFLTTLSTLTYFLGLKSKNLKSPYFIITSIIMGFAIATKYNALFFYILYAILFVFVFYKEIKAKPVNILKNYVILIPIISFLILFIIWPFLWHNPIEGLMESFGTRVGYSRYFEGATEYFLGKYPHNNPFYYFFVYFIATTPLIILFFLIFFVLKTILQKANNNYDFWFALYFLTPFLSVFSPLKIDGIRYIFTVYTPLAVCSSVGIYFVCDLFKRRVKIFEKNYIYYLVPLLTISSLIITAVKYHPYYWDYYNILVGGPKKVYEERLLDFGYWGEGLRGAIEYLNKNAVADSDVYLRSAVPEHVLPVLRQDLKVHSERYTIPDYIVITATGEWIANPDYLKYYPYKYDIIYQDNIMGAPLVRIYKRIGDKAI